MENNYIIIYGGSSLISKKLLEILSKDFNQFIIFWVSSASSRNIFGSISTIATSLQ